MSLFPFSYTILFNIGGLKLSLIIYKCYRPDGPTHHYGLIQKLWFFTRFEMSCCTARNGRYLPFWRRTDTTIVRVPKTHRVAARSQRALWPQGIPPESRGVAVTSASGSNCDYSHLIILLIFKYLFFILNKLSLIIIINYFKLF